MAEITSLPTLGKLNVASTDYLLVANSSTKKARKLQAQSLFATLTTVGVNSEELYVSVTNRNQINMKGLQSADTTKLTVTTASNNLVLTLLEAGLDLSKMNNATSGFLSAIDLSKATNRLGVVHGGTGLASIIKGSVLFANDTDTLTTTTLATNGQLLIGNTTTGYPAAGTITSSDGTITVTNGAGTIDIGVTSFSRLTTTLDTRTYNINLNTALGTSFLSGDGTNEGITIDASGRVFVGDNVPTVPTLNGSLVVGGNETNSIVLGQTANYGNRTLKFIDSLTGVAGMTGTIKGADAGGGNVKGGDVHVEAGSAAGSGVGGDTIIAGGNADGSTGGNIYLKTYTGKNTLATAVTVAPTGQATFAQPTTLSSTLSVGSTSTFTGAITTTGGIQPAAPVVQSEGTLTLSKANNAGRTTILPDISDHRVFTLPDPVAAGEYYHLVYFGALAADGHNLIIRGVNGDNTTFFHGAVAHHDTNNTTTTSVVYGDGDSNDTITLASGMAFDLHFLAASTTMYYIWGWSAGDTPITIAD